jgi:two-component system NtrC family response regulator
MNEKNYGKILLIDDEASILFSLSSLLTKQKYICDTAESGAAGIRMFQQKPEEYDIVITDFMMPGIDGMQVLKTIRQTRPEACVIMLTAHGNTENAVNAMKEGAYDYLSKPYENEKLKIVVRQAFERINLERENIILKNQLNCEYKFENIIGNSDKMNVVFDKISKVAVTDATVLITGESGTGKELVAKAIHFNSGRKHKNFVTINCAAIPADLLENELFGHEKGAYTGAHSEQKGKFELADGGTLFLDEIGDMPMQIQAKVLRAIQEQTIERLGGGHSIRVNVRLIAATNKDLEKEIAAKLFREDLYYRLNVINIVMPPLRERNGDITMLIKHFLTFYAKKINRREPVLTKNSLLLMQNYNWPGNVRQLQNTIERILVLCDGELIDTCELVQISGLKDTAPAFERSNQPPCCRTADPSSATPASGTENPHDGVYKIADLEARSYHEAQKMLIEQFELDYITRALKRNNGNIMRTSQQIGLNRTHFHEKLKQLKIDVEKFKDRVN